jgi:hypothetical protein
VENLIAALNDGVEDALSNPVRSIEEKILLMRDCAEHVSASNNSAQSAAYLGRAEEAQRWVQMIPGAILNLREPQGYHWYNPGGTSG